MYLLNQTHLRIVCTNGILLHPSHQQRLAHISVGKSNEIFDKVPIGTVIEFTEAFIKKEGPHNPEIRHVVSFE